ncbi:MAG: hypothetical protein M3Q97_11750 [Bacteroidota bacterium]|nr:hypothetical protein [Bacteroidota bacterium]
MKIKYFLIVCVALSVASCGARTNFATDLTVPVVQAFKSNSYNKLECMLPSEDQIEKGFDRESGPMGGVFYNKYTEDYQLQSLRAKLHNDFEIIQDQAETNGLDWDNVTMGGTIKEDNFEANPGFSIMNTPLNFPNGGQYILSYNVIQVDGDWRLYNNINLEKKRK